MPYIESVYPHLPSKWECALILSMNGERIITFDNQTIFKNKLAFKRAMKNLHDHFHIVMWRHEVNGCNEYKLTEFGESVANFLKEFL
jgi:hypothetical protein